MKRWFLGLIALMAFTGLAYASKTPEQVLKSFFDEDTGYLIISDYFMVSPDSFRKMTKDTFIIRTKRRDLTTTSYVDGIVELDCAKYHFALLMHDGRMYFHQPKEWLPLLPDMDLWQVSDLYCKNHSQMRRK